MKKEEEMEDFKKDLERLGSEKQKWIILGISMLLAAQEAERGGKNDDERE